MRTTNNLTLLLVILMLPVAACKKEDKAAKAPEFQNFKVESFTFNYIELKGDLIKGEEDILQYGVFVRPEKEMTINHSQTLRIALNDPNYSLNALVNTSTMRTLFITAYVITESNIYYSELLGIHDSDYYTIPYQGGKMMITNFLYQFSPRVWGDFGQLVGATDFNDGRNNMLALSQNNSQLLLYTGCKNLTIGGYSDWYVPSIEELKALVPYKIQMNFHSNYEYWSSTERDANSAWSYTFSNLKDRYLPKTSYKLCRCIRRE